MKAVIMAGGEGSRLRPLTCDLPKPMTRLCGRPILEYILDLLCRHGFTQAVVTTGYLSHMIADAYPEMRYGILSMKFKREEEPLGTAGSVADAVTKEDDAVLVISGDALCDFNLSKAMEFHLHNKAAATIIAKRVADPREYGLIRTGTDGKIIGFLEKPDYTQAVSDLANTGIYILSRQALDLIPPERPYDFGKNLFPLMMEKQIPMMAYEDEGYWCDIGDLTTYRTCQKDILEGRVDCELNGTRDAEGNVFADIPPKGNYRLVPPCYIGKAVSVGSGCVVEGSVLDDGCQLMDGVRVTDSILLPNAMLMSGVKTTGAIVGNSASLKNRAMLFEGCAIGSGAVVGKEAVIAPGVKVWPQKSVEDFTLLSGHLKSSVLAREYFDDDGISGEIGVELTPEFCARVGAALATVGVKGRIGLGCDGTPGSKALKNALSAGIQSAGAGVMDFGASFESLFRFSVAYCGLKLGIYAASDGHGTLRLVSDSGLPATRPMERSLEGILSRGEFRRVPCSRFGDVMDLTGMAVLYRAALLGMAPLGLSGIEAGVQSDSRQIHIILGDVLTSLGCNRTEEPLFFISADGKTVRMRHGKAELAHHNLLTLCCIQEFLHGQDVSVPYEAPRILDALAEEYDRKVYRYFSCPADGGDAYAREMAGGQLWVTDALMLCVKFLSFLAEKEGKLEDLVQLLPRYQLASRQVPVDGNPAGILGRFERRESTGITEGVLVDFDCGTALIRPSKNGRSVRILAECLSSETAEELCARVEELIRDQKELS